MTVVSVCCRATLKTVASVLESDLTTVVNMSVEILNRYTSQSSICICCRCLAAVRQVESNAQVLACTAAAVDARRWAHGVAVGVGMSLGGSGIAAALRYCTACYAKTPASCLYINFWSVAT